jgi:DNA repair protein RadC
MRLCRSWGGIFIHEVNVTTRFDRYDQAQLRVLSSHLSKAAMADTSTNDAAGHRSRLRARLLESGGAALADYELLEYLLALAIPRRDTKPLAKALLREFGGFPGLMSTDVDALLRIDGVGETVAAAIKVVQATSLRLLQNDVTRQPVLASWQSLLDYLRADMAYIGIERVRVLHLNSKNILIRDEVMSEGSIDQAAVYVREVIRRAIDLGSSALIIVHNHPSGDPSPSRADISLTRDIIDAGKRLNIAVHDHIIIASDGHSSMRALGLI